MAIVIENWALVMDRFVKPEDIKNFRTLVGLHGQVFGHPDFEPGHYVLTSWVKGQKDDLVITKTGSEYKLGEPSPEYMAFCPNAKAELMKHLRHL